MGEIADSMISGEFCTHCGSYIGKPKGYPRSCCEGLPFHNLKQYQAYVEKELNKTNNLAKKKNGKEQD